MTATSDFGTSKREGHNAAAYYSRSMKVPKLSKDTTVNTAPDAAINRVWASSATDMSVLPDNSVALMFGSPPYNVGKESDTDLSADEYLDLLVDVLMETHRVLEPGGKAVVNVANLGRKPYIRLSDIVGDLMEEIGFLARGEIIWIKGKGAGGNCAWGSWLSGANPSIRDLHEYLLVASKGTWGRVRKGESTMTPEQFMESTLSTWYIAPASAKRIGHPCPFPLELAERVINLYSYKDDLVLDPFMGSGQTAIAAENLGRNWVGYEIDLPYALLADKRIRQARLARAGRV